MTKDEAMRMALDALITAELDGNCEYGATNALRTALAQPEPDTWTPVEIGVDVTSEGAHVVGMYVLMPEAIRHVFYSQFHPAPPQHVHTINTSEERVHKMDKNEHEPVAWLHECNGDVQINKLPAECYGDNWTRIPLYAAPPQRKPLSEKVIWDIASNYFDADAPYDGVIEYSRAIEAAHGIKD